uniref:Seroin transcript 1B2 n=1 Tax=Cydia pomonella TaxID=82600 RepID=A0A455LAT3_CYDPO|nr:seroin transcript 1B2 [Cydia pomonella]
MASVRILIVAAVLVGCANAKFVWEPDTNDDFPAFKPFKMPKFEPITFDPIEPIEFEPIKFDPIEPIKIDDIKNHKPVKGEKYSGYSVSASKSTKTVNGKVVEDKAASSVLTNDNGKVDQQHAGYNKGEKEPRRNK